MSSGGPPRRPAWVEGLPKNWALGLGVILVVLVGALISKRSDDGERTGDTLQNKACGLLRQAEYTSTQASQDALPSLALMHSTSGLALTDAALKLATDKEMGTICGLNVMDLQRRLEAQQRTALVRVAPMLRGPVAPTSPAMSW